MSQPAIPDRAIPLLLLMDGLICALFAIFAYQIGLDSNPDWGRFRLVLLLLGITLASLSLLLFFQKRTNGIATSETAKTVFLLGHIWAVIFIIYAWFITFGNFTTWRNTTRYYTQLADAFGKGQLHIDAFPGAALLAAEDPYSDTSRPPFNDEVWDMSLYKGKFYLYWGPVPALLITPIQLFTDARVTDMYLVYFFFCGLLIFNSLIILKVWRLFFITVPVWNVMLSIFVIGLILPVLWSLNRPEVYQAAIGAGQFFLIGGMYFVISAFEDRSTIREGNLFLAGLFWACSVGSRAINVLSILFLVALTLFWIWRKQSKPIPWNGIFRTAASLFIPLVIGAALIGWYNWARFDSPLEFGLRYQITIYNLNRDMTLTFQPDYFPYNFYGYLFQPFEFIPRFPFIQSIKFSALLASLDITTPKLYAAGPLTGILFHAPFLFLAFIPFHSKIKNESHPSQVRKFALYLLGGSFLISFAIILFYFYGQMRFLVDLISQATLLAVIGYLQIAGNRYASGTRTAKVYYQLANSLIILTIAASFLLAFSSETNRMEKMNPALMETLNSLFTRQE